MEITALQRVVIASCEYPLAANTPAFAISHTAEPTAHQPAKLKPPTSLVVPNIVKKVPVATIAAPIAVVGNTSKAVP